MSADAKPIGLTHDAGWEIGARRTVELTPAEAWALLTSPRGLRCWLGEAEDWKLEPGATYHLPDGTSGTVRVVSDSHLRMTWQPPGWDRASTIQVRAIATSRNRAVISFHQEHLPDPDARSERSAFFHAALDALETLVAESP
ncbi:MAG: SRPBCC domain-containing protein [Anaerolineae bacterium]